MSKRKVATKRAQSSHKPATTPKDAPGLQVSARAQHKKQALIRGPKDRTSPNAAAISPETPREVNHEPKVETPILDNRAQAVALETILQASLQNASGPKMSDNIPAIGLDLFLPFANMQAYQAKLLEVTQANTQFAFEFVLRLARIKSPLEFWAVIAELTVRRILTVGKEAKEFAAFWQTDAIRGLALLWQIGLRRFTDSPPTEWARLWWRSKNEIDDGMTYRRQAWLRRRPVESFFPPRLCEATVLQESVSDHGHQRVTM